MEFKRLDDMEFLEIKSKYFAFFKNNITKDYFNKVSESNENKYSSLLNYLENKLKFSSTMGRADLQYGRNMIYGWYLEELFLEILKNNIYVKEAILFGEDKFHDFIIKNNKIMPKGKKSTAPDFLVTLKNEKKIFIELKSAAKNIFSIKKGNVDSLKKIIVEYDCITSILMIDINNGLYEMQGIDFFKNLRPFINQRMEGQLCYDFPSPKKSFSDFVNEDLELISQINLNEDISIKKLKLLKKAQDIENKKIIKLIKNKLKIEKLIEELDFFSNDIENKIKNIEDKVPDVKMSWEEIEHLLK